MVGWHHQFNGYEIGQTPGDGEGQRGLACCGPWGSQKVRHDLMTEPQKQQGVALRAMAITNAVEL